MIKKFLVLVGFIILSLMNTSVILAATKGAGDVCDPGDTCPSGYSCQRVDPVTSLCQKSGASGVFGKVVPPSPLAGFVTGDPTGAKGISQFLSNLVSLIYVLAAVVLIFMLLWGAFDWITSEGDKEKIASARGKLINAVIGIILFAIAFAVIQVLGTFTGFEFFAGQKEDEKT